MQKTPWGFSTLIGISLLPLSACAPAADASPVDASPVSSITQAFSCEGAIDCGNFACGGAIDCGNLEKIPGDMAFLLEASGQFAKVLGNFNTGVAAAFAVLQMLDVIESQADQQAAQFAALKAQLEQLGVSLSTQQLVTARENRLSSMRGYVSTVRRFAARSGTGLIDRSMLHPEPCQHARNQFGAHHGHREC